MAQVIPAPVNATSGSSSWTSLLNTKFYVPQRPNLVRRPRLTQRLGEGLRQRLVLISAPPGFGKTTLISEWLAAGPGMKLAWLSLDEGDNDPVRFVAYLAGALQRIRPGVGESLPAMLYSPRPAPLEVALTVLLNDVTAIPGDFGLILDDYHTIDCSSVHDAIAFLIDRMPPQMHVVITTRIDPPLPLSLWRVRGELTEIRADDLRFTAEEAAAFLNQVMGLGLCAEDIRVLETQTEGWVAGLQLAALSLSRQRDVSEFVRTFAGSNRYLVDYLTEEVLRRQPERLQEFLLQTSILRRLQGALCDAVTGGNDGQTTLELLEESNLFVIPLDEERRWYRYHHLFASFLRDRLVRLHPDAVRALHSRAGQWYAQANMLSDAVEHALAAEDPETAAGLIEAAARRMVMRGEMRTLDQWMQAMPEEIIRLRPRLCLAHAWVLALNDQLEAVERRLQDAEQGLGVLEGEKERAAALSEIAAFRANIAADRGDLPRTIELSRLALQDLPDGDAYLQGIIALNLGFAYMMNGNMDEAVQALIQANQFSRTAGNIQTALIAANELGRLWSIQGCFQRAIDLYRQSLDLATERGGRRLPVAGVAFLGLGELLFIWNELESATQALEESLVLCGQFGYIEAQVNAHLHLARVKRAQGDIEGMQAVIRRAWALNETHHLSPEVLGHIARREVQLQVMVGDLEAGARWIQERRLRPEAPFTVQNEYDYVVLAQVLVAQGRCDEALGVLDRLLESARSMNWIGRISHLLFLKAVVMENLGHSDRAWECIEAALELAAPEGPINFLLDEGPVTRTLLRRAVERGCFAGYAGRLLAVLAARHEPEPAASLPALGAGSIFSPAMVEADGGLPEFLSERELEVLRLMAAGHSNREMAETLFLAEGTIKKHINNIYVKLDVHSRTQALARARELALL